MCRTRQTRQHSPSRVARTRQTRRHSPSRVARTRQTRRHSPSRVARTRQTRERRVWHVLCEFSESGESGEFGECRLDRFMHIKYVIIMNKQQVASKRNLWNNIIAIKYCSVSKNVKTDVRWLAYHANTSICLLIIKNENIKPDKTKLRLTVYFPQQMMK